MRTCALCGESKLPYEFSFEDRAKLRLKRRCKACLSARTRAWNAGHAARRRTYQREYYQRHRPRLDEAQSRWRAANPEKAAAIRREAARRWRARHPRVIPSPLPLLYPYGVRVEVGGAELVLLINGLVPRGLPESIRADVCQELALLVLSGEVAVGRLVEHVSACVRAQYRFLPSKRHLSISGDWSWLPLVG